MAGTSYSGDDQDSNQEAWGWLVCLSYPLRIYICRTADFVIGRDPDYCDLVLEEKVLSTIDRDFNEENFVRLSRIHFKIGKALGEERAALTDLSSNGTWVDGVKVGKERKFILQHCSEICILNKELLCFRYLDRAIMEAKFPSCITGKYLVGEVLGNGSTSEVRLGYRLTNKFQIFALKIFKKKDDINEDSVPTNTKLEIKFMQNLSHPCILKYHEVCSNPTSTTIVMEYAAGGDLFDAINHDLQNNNFSENVTKIYFYQIAHCVQYLHRNKVCHRDLKLENILLTKYEKISRIKVADFGLSKTWNPFDDPLRSYVGTPVYMAPEIVRLDMGFKTCYSYKIDCWSLGVILYTMLSGKMPFSTGPTLNQMILSGRYHPMSGRDWEKISNTAKHLVSKLLTVDPEERLSTDQILHHPWFVNDANVVNVAHRIMFGRFRNRVCYGFFLE